MSLAETAVQETAESTEPRSEGNLLPIPGEYLVGSSGAPQQVPPGSIITLDGKGLVWIGDKLLGPADLLFNGDFEVRYVSGKYLLALQFRQTGEEAKYMFGVSMPIAEQGAEHVPGAMEDPPVTGVWGAEARPPHGDDYV